MWKSPHIFYVVNKPHFTPTCSAMFGYRVVWEWVFKPKDPPPPPPGLEMYASECKNSLLTIDVGSISSIKRVPDTKTDYMMVEINVQGHAHRIRVSEENLETLYDDWRRAKLEGRTFIYMITRDQRITFI